MKRTLLILIAALLLVAPMASAGPILTVHGTGTWDGSALLLWVDGIMGTTHGGDSIVLTTDGFAAGIVVPDTSTIAFGGGVLDGFVGASPITLDFSQNFAWILGFFDFLTTTTAPDGSIASFFGAGLDQKFPPDVFVALLGLPGPPDGWYGTFNATSDDVTGVFEYTYDNVPVPEPASLLLLATGVVGLGRFARRRSQTESMIANSSSPAGTGGPSGV